MGIIRNSLLYTTMLVSTTIYTGCATYENAPASAPAQVVQQVPVAPAPQNPTDASIDRMAQRQLELQKQQQEYEQQQQQQRDSTAAMGTLLQLSGQKQGGQRGQGMNDLGTLLKIFGR